MTNNKMMNRAEGIEIFVRDHMTGDDLATVIEYMNSYDGSFADCEYILMDEFDEIMKEESPMTVARAIHKGIFDPNDDYFKVVYDGEDMALFSAAWEDVVEDAESRIDDIIDHLVNHYSGDTGFNELDDMVLADDDTLFDEYFEEVEQSDMPHIA